MNKRRLYEKVWANPAYAKYSPGEQAVPVFRQIYRKRGYLLDIGCGTGRAALKLQEAGWKVAGLDFVDARQVDIPFHKGNILTWDYALPGLSYDYGYCCDVMEHLEPSTVKRALVRISDLCAHVFFTIHFGPDQFGATVGHPLHLTVQPFVWWRDLLKEYGTLRTEAYKALTAASALDVK